ncbi:hypothetical protein ABG067_003635 [Albugo candida]
MAPSKIHFQLLCIWALCLMSLIECREKGKCILETDGEPDDMLSIILMAKSRDREVICGYGVIINLVWPTEDKKAFIKLIFETAGVEQFTILNGANSPQDNKNLPFDKIDATSHKILEDELMNLDMKFYILILALLRSLAMVLCDLEERRKATFDNILEIYWSGGWSESFVADYNLFRDPEYTIKFMNLIALEKKIHISSSLVSIYRGGLGETSFPKLVEFFTKHMTDNELFKALIERQTKWNEELILLLKGKKEGNFIKEMEKGIQFCASDVLATMLMFHPGLSKKEEDVYYTVEVVKADPESTKIPNWDSMKVSVVPTDKKKGEDAIKAQRELMIKGVEIEPSERLYRHQVYTQIADGREQNTDFKQEVISLLEKYVHKSNKWSALTKTSGK